METLQIKHRAELYKLLPKDFVSIELGVAEGLFSRDILAMGAGKHYMVDAYRQLTGQFGDGGYSQSWHNNNFRNAHLITEPYGSKREIIKALTVNASAHFRNEGIDLVYVDALHTKEGVSTDIRYYWPKLKPGGIMAFHDYENPNYGVKEAVNEWAADHNLEVNLIPENHPNDAGAWIRKPL